MNINFIILDSLYNEKFYFKNLLRDKDTIFWKNCEDLYIKVDSKINKFIFFKCKNIKLIMSDAIIGLEIENCENINIKIKKNKTVNCIELYKSNIKLNKKLNKKVFLLVEKSKINYI
jgi:hypothetical protein